MGAALLLLLEVAVVIVDDVDSFPCAGWDERFPRSRLLQLVKLANRRLLHNLQIIPFSHRPVPGRTTVPDAAR
jgi:hypothetical protein